MVQVLLREHAIAMERWFNFPPNPFNVRPLTWETLRRWKWQTTYRRGRRRRRGHCGGVELLCCVVIRHPIPAPRRPYTHFRSHSSPRRMRAAIVHGPTSGRSAPTCSISGSGSTSRAGPDEAISIPSSHRVTIEAVDDRASVVVADDDDDDDDPATTTR